VLLTRALVLAVYTILDDAKQLVLKARRRVARKAPAPTPAPVPAPTPVDASSRVMVSPPPTRGGAED